MSEQLKRKNINSDKDSDSDSESDDDFGPLPSNLSNDNDESNNNNNLNNDNENDNNKEKELKKQQLRKRKKLQHEQLFIDNLPSTTQYEKSYMHRDNVTHVAVARSLDFIITGSCDGHVKFWKKMVEGIEFVKHYQAHLGALTGLVVSPNDQKLATIAEDKMIKFFDITCYDMSNMITLQYIPGSVCWLSSRNNSLYDRVAVSDLHSGLIRIYGDDQEECLHELSIHSHPVRTINLHTSTGIVISTDSRGMIEYWSSETYLFPELSTGIKFQMKIESDLYELVKNRVMACSLTISPRQDYFVITCSDYKIRLFDFYTGKVKKIYNENIDVYTNQMNLLNTSSSKQQQKQNSSLSSYKTNSLVDEIGRKSAIEREYQSDQKSVKEWNALFDESGNFLIFGTLKGIKIVNLSTNKVVTIIGSSESGERFINLALYQGTPKVDLQLMLTRLNESGKSQTSDELTELVKPDPMLFCTSFHKRRFFCFSRRLPNESEESRDVLNEKPKEDERIALDVSKNNALGSEAVIETQFGDIHLKLFAHECPKTVENFCTHARNGYYDNLIFHRVIRGFMIQTGDPLGDGTGGESIWGGEFEDEFNRNLRHDRPFTVSMANAGPNTNGSQFFITTAPTPWLDNKHTVFGRVTRGYEVIAAIESAEVGSYDRPYQDIKMKHIEIVK